MGKRATNGIEEAQTVLSGSFTATGQSSSERFYGIFNVAVWGTFVGTTLLERSFDGGTTWFQAVNECGNGATEGSFTATASSMFGEPERGVLYRFNCTAYTSGTINYRASQSAG